MRDDCVYSTVCNKKTIAGLMVIDVAYIYFPSISTERTCKAINEMLTLLACKIQVTAYTCRILH